MVELARFSGRRTPQQHLPGTCRRDSAQKPRTTGNKLHHQSASTTLLFCSAQRPASKTDTSPLFRQTTLSPPFLFAAPPHCCIRLDAPLPASTSRPSCRRPMWPRPSPFPPSLPPSFTAMAGPQNMLPPLGVGLANVTSAPSLPPMMPPASLNQLSQPPLTQVPPSRAPPPPLDTMRAYRACLNCRNRKSKCDLDINQGRPVSEYQSF
jgi:hypothetical protein